MEAHLQPETRRRKKMTFSANSTDLRNKNLRMLCFPTWEEFWKRPSFTEEDLRSFPHEIGPCALIVPAEAVPLLKARGLKFDVLAPVTKSDLTPRQKKAWKNNKAVLYGFGPVMFFLVRSKHLNKKRMLP